MTDTDSTATVATTAVPVAPDEMAVGMLAIAHAGNSAQAFQAVRIAISSAVEVGMWTAGYGDAVRAALGEIELISAAREWVSECTWADLEPEDVDDLTDDEIKRGVERYYDGGWQGFVRDCQ